MSMRVGLVIAIVVAVSGGVALADGNGRSTLMPSYYDDELFEINFTELGSEETLLAHNKSLNVIYMSDDCMPDGGMFVSVIDAIQGDGFNPLWQEVQVVFDNPAFPCQQLTSDTAIEDAADAQLVRLDPTDEVYRCSVVGKK